MSNQLVTVIEYGGLAARKVLVEERGDVLLVTTEEEWARSKKECRAPIVVGFRREYLTVSLAENRA